MWISINPSGEPFDRKMAAVALSRNWGSDAILGSVYNLSPTELAQLYNNAEALGLDLTSLGYVSEEKVTHHE